jgi:glycosyltransferase involved in cell wall biosynthesis
MNKYTAKRGLMVDGKIYNQGDIVFTDNPIDGLELLEQENQLSEQLTAHKILRDYKVSNYITKEKPEISVVITFHNQEKFINDCLGCFFRQTIKVPFEIITIDDDSQDNTQEFISKNYNQVRYFRKEFHNAGKGRNFGCSQAQGKFICYFDGDDFPYPQYLEKLYNKLKDNPEYNLAYSRFDYEGAGLHKFIIPSCNHFEWSESWIKFACVVNTPTMIKREIAEKAKWDEKLNSYEDYEFNLSLLNAGAKGIPVREKLWNYRMHGESKWGSGQAFNSREKDREHIRKKWKIKEVKAETTLVSLIATDNVLDEYFDSLSKIKMPREKIHYFAFIDSDNEKLIDIVKQKVEPLGFLSVRIFFTNEKNLFGSTNFTQRAMRIARNEKTIIKDIGKYNAMTEFCFITEDDTIIPPNAYEKMIKRMRENENLVYLSGVETSRGSDAHIGLAILTEVDGEIVHRICPPYQKTGIMKVNSGGWYCWFGRPAKIEKLQFRCIEDGRYLGPDALMVFDLNKMGFDTEADWSIQCKHYDPNGKKWLEAKDCNGWNIKYHKLGNNKFRGELVKIIKINTKVCQKKGTQKK